LIVGVDLKSAIAIVDRAFGTVGIGGGERRAHVFETDAVFEHCVWVEFDTDRRQCRTADDDLADAADLGELLLQYVAGGVIHLTLGERLRRHCQNQDRRVGGIHLAISRIGAQA